MNIQSLRQFIEAYVSLSEPCWQEIKQVFQFQLVPAQSLLLQEGQVCKHLYFLERGLLRFISTSPNGEVYTKFFTDVPYLFTSQFSALNYLPAKEGIETIEESEIWSCTIDQAQNLMRFPEWAQLITKITSEVQDMIEEIMLELQTMSAEERYATLMEREPALLARLPQRILASYLGIAPPSLSRIKQTYAAKQGLGK